MPTIQTFWDNILRDGSNGTAGVPFSGTSSVPFNFDGAIVPPTTNHITNIIKKIEENQSFSLFQQWEKQNKLTKLE